MPSYAIFGASRGIGLELVKQLSDESSNTVFAIVRNPDGSTHLKAFLESSQRTNVHVITGDADSLPSIEDAAKVISMKTGGALDVFFYNALGGPVGNPILTYTSPEALKADFDGAFEANLYAPLHAARVFLPLVRKSNLKQLVAMSTGLADIASTVKSEFEGIPAYCISKAALSMAWAKLAAEVKEERVTCLTISPGLVDTSATRTGPPPTAEEMAGFGAMVKKFHKAEPQFTGMPISPEESVNAILTVLSNATLADSGKLLSHHGSTTQWL
ncbi:short-chain dehydrogenases/reductase [Pseudohyphozyma bogoriensis]|nr:short-chain dehydrogenases/reductase [Pseudohyphozyma bogoriensis]